MNEEIKKLAEMQAKLAERAYLEYLPVVEDIIATRTKNINQISLTLDSMLDFCFDDNMLLLYRKLCRYLYDIDQETTANYINAYREMWDEEGKNFGNMDKKKNAQ